MLKMTNFIEKTEEKELSSNCPFLVIFLFIYCFQALLNIIPKFFVSCLVHAKIKKNKLLSISAPFLPLFHLFQTENFKSCFRLVLYCSRISTSYKICTYFMKMGKQTIQFSKKEGNN